MRLRTSLVLGVLAVCALLGNRFSELKAHTRETKQIAQALLEAQQISREASALLVLGQETRFRPNARSIRQWKALHSEVEKTLAQLGGRSPALMEKIQPLQETTAALPPLFEALATTVTTRDEGAASVRHELLADQLNTETRRISDGAFDLAETISDQAIANDAVGVRNAVRHSALLLGLVLMLAGLAFWRVLRPVARLQAAAQAMQSGDLSARTGHQSRDELGRLALAFDTMADAILARERASQAQQAALAVSENGAQQARRDLENILDALPSFIGYWDQQLVCRMGNQAYHQWYGLAPGSMPGRKLNELMSQAQFESIRPLLDGVLRGEPQVFERPLLSHDGRNKRHVLAHFLPDVVGSEVRGFYVLVHDISEQTEARAQLREALVTAQAATQAKSAFLANMSHEIRTPLNAVVGLSYLLERDALDTEQRNSLGKIRVAGNSLLTIVNDILDLSKIEAGEMTIERAAFSLPLLLDDLAAMLTLQANEKGLVLRVMPSDDLPAAFLGDSTRVRQILLNLISNAIKFTALGSVTVTVVALEQNAQRATLRFSVRDTGIGIDPPTQAQLFKPFSQADESTTRRFGGTGLGLSIVKQLAQLMGGEVGVESALGRGSEFWVTLPLAVAQGSAEAATVLPIETLMADDDELQRGAVAVTARALGWRMETLPSGQALLRRVRERMLAGHVPDALVIDWQMPELDGLQTLAALHQEFGEGKLPAVLMITADHRANLLAAPHAELVDGVLTKPVSSSSLFNAVYEAVARRKGNAERLVQASRLDKAGGLWLAGVRVLVVDDSAINLEVARRILESEGAFVAIASDGEQALLQVANAAPGFDAVLLDVQMPVLGGVETVKRIRDELGFKTLPVLALTAGATVVERQNAFDAGMNDFISKPFEPQAMVRLLRRHVERVRGSFVPLAQRATPTANALPPRHWPRLEGIDEADVSNRLSGDLELFASMLTRLFEEFDDLASPAPATALLTQDPLAREALAARFHKLRGSAGLLGARALWQAAGHAEQVLRGSSPGEPEPAMEQLGAALRALQQSVGPWLSEMRPARASSALPPGEAATLDPAALTHLIHLLREQSLAAKPAFSALSAVLQTQLTAPEFERLQAAMAQLRFQEAALVLDKLQP
jgi:PAS domain S-box-containing protein